MPITDQDTSDCVEGLKVQSVHTACPNSRRYLYSAQGRDSVSIVQNKMLADEEVRDTTSNVLTYMKSNMPNTEPSAEITDYEIQAVVDEQMPLAEKNRMMERIIRCPDSLNRMEALIRQKNLLREWWRSEWKED